MDTARSFHLFDVRGPVPEEVNERLAFAIAKAVGHLWNPRRVIVASDNRHSSPMLRQYLIDGISEDQREVVDLSEVPIAQFAFSVVTGDFDFGFMVTASHSSLSENGFKFLKNGIPLNEQEIIDLRNATDKFLKTPIVHPRADIIRKHTTEEYINELINRMVPFTPKIKIAIDLSKTAIASTVITVFDRLKINYHLVKSDKGGNPLLEENRIAIEKDILKTNSDLGLIWDSDGDRVVAIDSRGKMIPMSFLLGLLGSDVVSRIGHGKVAVDVRAGLVVSELVKKAGGEVSVYPSWSQFIKFAMYEDTGIVFGGEISGHFIFREFYCIDDGIYAALRIINLFETTDVNSQLQDLSKKYFEMPEHNFPIGHKDSAKILQKITEHFRKDDRNQVHVVEGLSVFGEGYKFNLRSSVTEPFLRLNLETHSQSVAQDIFKEISNLIES